MMNKIKNISNLVCILMIVAYLIQLSIIYESLPSSIPTHFDFFGRPDDYCTPISTIIYPLIAILMIIILEFVGHFPNARNYPVNVTLENKERLFFLGMIMISLIKVVVTIMLLYIGLCCIYSILPIIMIYVFITLLVLVCLCLTILMIKYQ